MIDDSQLARLFDDAQALFDEGKLLHALQLYRRITEAAPENEIGWIQLSRVLMDLRKLGPAEEALRSAVRVSKRPAEILLLVGDFHFRSGEASKAQAFYRKASLQEQSLTRSSRARLHFHWGLICRDRGQSRVAEYHFRRARAIDQGLHRASEALAELLLERGASSEAAHILRQALSADPSNALAQHLLGRALAAGGRWEQAYRAFTAAIEKDPLQAASWHMCGEALLSLENLAEAERYLERAIELNPRCTEAFADFGELFLRRGDSSRALSYFERALQLEPGNRKALWGKRKLSSSR